jgi:hypothetical protein
VGVTVDSEVVTGRKAVTTHNDARILGATVDIKRNNQGRKVVLTMTEMTLQ